HRRREAPGRRAAAGHRQRRHRVLVERGRLMNRNVVVVDHPLVQHKLSLIRSKEISTGQFRALLHEIAPLMLYEATRDLPLTTREIETPLARFEAPVLAGKKLCFVPI